MLRFVVARNSTTGRDLIQAVRALGVQVGDRAQGVVSYGVALPGESALPTLNANAGRLNKLDELETLSRAGVLVVPFHRQGTGLGFPMLSRQVRHQRGTDIKLALGPTEKRWFDRSTDFWTQYVPMQSEFRVWIYRRRNIGTYEKQMRRPDQYKKIGGHYGNGFVFEHVEHPREDLVALASQAVEALGLDFGAVDILVGMDRRLYVLEVNTAPGTEQRVLGRLAAHIQRWEQQGFPARRGTRDATARR